MTEARYDIASALEVGKFMYKKDKDGAKLLLSLITTISDIYSYISSVFLW